jgi:acetate---CoA ligase (ADP-forming)
MKIVLTYIEKLKYNLHILTNNQNNIFAPKTVALIGASEQEGSVGRAIMNNLMSNGYEGKIFPINPKQSTILGQKCYSSISDLEIIPDLAIIAVPAKIVPQVTSQIAQKGTKGVIIVSAGFGEIGIEGQKLEDEVVTICNQNGISLIGPNCLGICNPKIGLNATFSSDIPPKGNISFLSQSGALCTAIIDMAQSQGLGFAKFVSLGNKPQCSEIELIEYLANDPDTDVIAIYAEQLTNAKAIIEVSNKCQKPIIILKSGKTDEGSKATSSHTGALASSNMLYDTLFRQSGITSCYTLEEFILSMQILSSYPTSHIKNTAIITNAGGPGVLATDSVIKYKLGIAEISDELKTKLSEALPPFAGLNNPIDLIGDAQSDRYKSALNILLADNTIDSALVIVSPQAMTDFENIVIVIIDAKNKYKKPIVVSLIGEKTTHKFLPVLRSNNIPVTKYPENIAMMLSRLNNPAKSQTPILTDSSMKKDIEPIFDKYRSKSQNYITESDAKFILSKYGIRTPVSKHYIDSNQITENYKADFGNKKVAVKILSPDVMHKTDVGGVLLNVESSNIAEAYNEICQNVASHLPNARIDGVHVEEMIDKTSGFEFVIGANRDPNLGMSIMVGLGGIYVEMLKDVLFGFCPLSDEDINYMLDNLKSSALINGTRGKIPLDRQAMFDCIKSLSQLLHDFPSITEIDINPVLLMEEGKGLVALDGKIVFDI